MKKSLLQCFKSKRRRSEIPAEPVQAVGIALLNGRGVLIGVYGHFQADILEHRIGVFVLWVGTVRPRKK